MYKELEVGGDKRKIAFLSNGLTPLFYKQVFKTDLLKALNENGEFSLASDKIPELGFIMMKQAEKADMTKVNYEGYLEWLSGFEPLDLTLVSPEITDIYFSNSIPSEEPKKKGRGKAKG
mgnify:FL=1